MFCKQWKA